MAFVFRTFGCDSGGEAEVHTFELMQDREEGPPGFCPKCGHPVDQTSSAIPGTHAIGGANFTKAVDQTYRALEESSAARAAATGQPALKITDMNDRLREGDVAYKMPRNSVMQWMGEAAKVGANYGWGGGSMTGFNPSTGAAPLPKSGWTGPAHPALAAIQGPGGISHNQTTARVATAGQMNKGSSR